MAIVVLQHDARCTPGRLGKVLRDTGKVLDVRRLDLPTEELGGPKGNRHIPTDFEEIEGVISLGGHMNVTDDPPAPWMAREIAFLKDAHDRRLPLVGICLGHQLIAHALGGAVGPMESVHGEQGMVKIRQHPVANTDVVLAGVPWTSVQFQSHTQEVKTLPPGAMCLQFSDLCKVQSFRAGLRTYGFQYHFECDWPMIEEFGAEMCAPGASRKAVLAALEPMRAAYPECARVAQRLCENIASVLMPVTRKITA